MLKLKIAYNGGYEKKKKNYDRNLNFKNYFKKSNKFMSGNVFLP